MNEREKFEVWFDKEYSNYGCSYKKGYDAESDGYSSDFVDGRYQAWQARVPDGSVVVEREPTEEMYLAGFNAKSNGLNTVNIYKAMIEAGEVK